MADFVRVFQNAEIDAVSLSSFMSAASGVKVNRRLAPPIDTLEYFLAYLRGIEQVYVQPTGSVTVGSTTIRTVGQIIADADSLATTEVAKSATAIANATSAANDATNAANAARADAAGVMVEIKADAVIATNDAINNTAVEGGVLADTFVTVTANGVGAVARTQRDKNSDTVSVKDFGAKGDGVTDDRQAIQDAVNFVSSIGGGTLVVPAGEYLLDSKTTEGGVNTNCLIKWKPNVSLCGVGESSVIKVGSMPDSKFYLFYNPTVNLGDVQFYNFKIDANGSQNTVTATSGFDQWLIAIAQANAVRINKVFVYNAAGQQSFSIGTNSLVPTVKNVWISECSFYKVANDIAGNELQGDHSSLYISSDKAYIWNNNFKNDSVLDQRATAIECHSLSATIFGNMVENYNIGVITAAQIRAIDEHTIFQNTLKCRVAWRLYVSHNWDFKKLRFDTNSIVEREESVGQQNTLDFSSEVRNHTTGTVFITGNNITGSGKTISTTGMHAIIIGNVKRVVVQGNDFKHVVGQVVYYGAVPTGADVNLEFEGNTISDCNTTTNTSYKTAMTFFEVESINKLSIKGNTFESSSSAFTNKILNGAAKVSDFTFIGNTEVGSGIVNQITWSTGNLVNANIQHTTSILAKPTIDASIGSNIISASQTDEVLREYSRVLSGAAIAFWKTVHYVTDSKAPTSFASAHGDEAINTKPAQGLPSKWLCTVAGNPGTWLPIGFVGSQTSSTADMSSLTTDINKLNKVTGKTTINSTDKKIYYATGDATNSTWVSIDGITTLTPI